MEPGKIRLVGDHIHVDAVSKMFIHKKLSLDDASIQVDLGELFGFHGCLVTQMYGFLGSGCRPQGKGHRLQAYSILSHHLLSHPLTIWHC